MNRKWVVAFLVLVPLVTSGWLARETSAGRAAVMTPVVFLNVMVQTGEWRPLNLVTRRPTVEEHAIESPSGRKLTLRIWIPRPLLGLKPGTRTPAALIYTPFIGGGLEDPRLVNLADAFSRAGIASLTLWDDDDSLVASERDIQDVVAAFQFLAAHPAVRREALGLVGISYGNGPVILAAADPAIREDVRFIVSHAGYYNLENVLRFIMTGEYEYGEIRGKAEPNRYGHEILSRTLERLGVDDAAAKAFTESPKDFEKNLRALPKLRELAQHLSPARVIGELRADRIYLIHATDDTFIPYTESMRLRDAFTRQNFAEQNLGGRARLTTVRFQLIDVFEHGTPRKPTLENLRRYWIPNFAKAVGFLYTLLRETYAL